MFVVRRIAPVLVSAIIVGLAAPAVGAAQVKPRAGKFTGTANYATAVPVTFTVNHKRTKVVDFESQADVKPGCTAPNSSFQTPITPKKISKSGHFKQSYGGYFDSSGKSYHVTVTVKGHFTSPAKAVGTFSLVSKKYKHCNLTASWSAKRG